VIDADAETPFARPRAAGTVIVAREDDGITSVLMMRRSPSLRFMGGYWVFPGGATDRSDSPDEDDPVLVAARAASRELSEEAGLDVAAAELTYLAHWITPSYYPKRFDTRFFVARAPAHQQPRLGDNEATALAWVDPRRWLEFDRSDAFPLSAPTLLVLRELAESLDACGSLAALLSSGDESAVPCVIPKCLNDDEIVLPWDPEYVSIPGHGHAWDTDAITRRTGWPSRLGDPVAHGGPPGASVLP
jgi:8-oxo-dGTP pyrophosphatase MutT (NUDIX family)